MVRAEMIVEMAGRPSPHVKETLKKHVGALESFKDIEVISIKVNEPREIEGSKGFFTCFAEVDFETPSFSRMSEIMFDFMPSSVEVIEPSKVTLDSAEATNLLNNLSGRLHRYDEVARMAQMRVKQLATELQKFQKPDTKELEKVKKTTKKTSKKKKASVKKK